MEENSNNVEPSTSKTRSSPSLMDIYNSSRAVMDNLLKQLTERAITTPNLNVRIDNITSRKNINHLSAEGISLERSPGISNPVNSTSGKKYVLFI